MRRLACLLLALCPVASGYIRFMTATTPPVAMIRADNSAIPFFVNNQIVPGVQSSATGTAVTVISADSNPQQALHAAVATWNAVGTANIHFLPLQSTTAVIDPNDFQMTIAIGSTASDLSLVGGALAVTADFAVSVPANISNKQLVTCSSNCAYPAGGIYDSDIIINPKYTFSTTGAAGTYDFQAVMTHEFGHSLGANHTGILGATMFQFQNNVQRSISTDDLSFAESVYPLPSSPVGLGTISGTVTGSSGTVPYALLTMTNMATGAVVGGLTSPDGTYSVQVPPGAYQLYVEPLSGVVKPANLYFTASQAALVQSFQSTVMSGSVSVAANETATANISVNGGTSALGVPDVGVTSVNGSVPATFSVGGPTFVASGQSVDLLFAGAGFDNSLSDTNFTIFGQGVSVHPGGVRVDPAGQIFGGFTILRVTLDVASQQTLGLASVFVTKGSSTLSLSGALVIGPPTPTTTSQSIVSAAGFTAVAPGVSPGGLSALFDLPNTPNLGPATPVSNAGYDPYGFLSPNLAGVAVTFDGIPAPLFFVYGGQINLQVPFEVAGKTSTQMTVNYLGSASAPITVPVVASQPAFWTVGSSSAVYVGNADDSLNTAANPAARGSSITVYGTGVGALGYAVTTGEGAPVPPSFSANGFTCMIGGANAPIAFAGWTPTAVALAQWNVTIPSTLTATGALPIVCSNATGSTQPGLTVFVK